MARPQTDIEAGRQLLIGKVEEIIRQRGGVDISMAELASAAGMSPSNIYRFFENKEALLEAIAENWFAEKTRIMEEVVAANLPPRDKMYAFFQRRYAVMVARYEAEPDLFRSYCELGSQYFEVVRGYVDLGDHFLAMIVAEAMDEGHFGDLNVDRAVSLINLMIQPFCNPDLILQLAIAPTEEKLGQIIDTIFVGLGRSAATESTPQQVGMRLVS